MAIIIWFLVICSDLHNTSHFLWGVCVLRARSWSRGISGSSLVVLSGRTAFSALGWCRLLAMSVVVAVRVCISTMLLGVGVDWLLATTSVEEIILNAAVLSFVMDVDEIVFAILVTGPAKTLLRKMDELPLKLPSASAKRRARTKGACWPCIVWWGIAVLVIFVAPILQRNLDSMEDLKFHLCGGNVDFVTAVSTTNTILLKQTESFSDASTSDRLLTRATREAVWSPIIANVSLSWLASPAELFSVGSAMSMLEGATTLWYCYDDDDFMPQRNVLIDELGLPEDWTCGTVSKSLCWPLENSLLRVMCPVTCGCAHPFSPQYLSGPFFGCPRDSCKMRLDYKVEVEKISCSTSDVVSHENWTTYVDNVAVVFDVYGVFFEITADLRLSGCDAVARWQEFVCADTAALSTMALWCPVECGCRAPPLANTEVYYNSPCPPRCDAWRSNYQQSLDGMPCTDVSASEFSSGSSADFLDLHLATFTHAFSRAWGEEGHVKNHLQTYGCQDLPPSWCGLPMSMRAVCPVSCGCTSEPDLYGCRSSCSDNTSWNQSGLE